MSDRALALLSVDPDPARARARVAVPLPGVPLLTAAGVAEALAAVARDAPPVGALVLPWPLPEGDAAALLARVRAAGAGAPRGAVPGAPGAVVLVEGPEAEAAALALRGVPGVRLLPASAGGALLGAALEGALGEATRERRLHALEARLATAEPLAAVGELAAGITHELLNPVTTLVQDVHLIQGSVGVLREALGASPEPRLQEALEDLRALLEDVAAATRQVREVGQGLRALAREGTDADACELAEVAAFAVKLARVRLRSRVPLRAEGPPVRVRPGRARLTRALMPLLANAVQAAEVQGRQGRVEVRWHAGPQRVVLEVRDNGPGLTPEALERAYEPFFSTRAGAAGLGLPVARETLAAGGGTLRLRPGEDGGTVAEVLLLPVSEVTP